MKNDNPYIFSRGVTKIVEATLNAKDEFVVIHQGGTSSGKTYGLMQCALLKCLTEPKIVFDVIAEDIPKLKKGVMADLESILDNDPHLNQYIASFNKTDRIYRFYNGSKMQFYSCDDFQSAKTGKRDYTFINEANGVAYSIAQELMMRTKKQVWIDFNPNAEFWAHNMVWKPPVKNPDGTIKTDELGREIHEIDKWENQSHLPKSERVVPEYLWGKPKVVLFKSNWKHNRAFLTPQTIAGIEALKHKDYNAYRVYGLGEIGQIKGLIYPDVKVIPVMPTDEELDRINYGLDFGFSEDPTTIVKIGIKGNDLYCREMMYGKGIMLDQLAARCKKVTNSLIWADSAASQMIAELRAKGVHITGVQKKPGSINAGITLVKNFDNIYCTADSINMRKEFNNYKWKENQDGVGLPETVDLFNHTMDAMRYAVMTAKYYAGHTTIVLDDFG